MEDVISVILKARSGDEDSFADIVALYTPMMQSTARKHGFDFDEVFSELCMALYRAVKTFDEHQTEVTFGLYAQICVTRALCDLSRIKSKTPLLECDADVESIAEESDVAGDLIRKEEKEAFRRDARGLLSEYEYSVLLKWLAGDKTADIAEALSVSAKSVDNAKARIQKKLRDGLKPY